LRRTARSIELFSPSNSESDRTTLQPHIDRFGEDGYGEKPVHMDPVDYWLSHLNPAIFNRID
jgi:hypothetical protein